MEGSNWYIFSQCEYLTCTQWQKLWLLFAYACAHVHKGMFVSVIVRTYVCVFMLVLGISIRVVDATYIRVCVYMYTKNSPVQFGPVKCGGQSHRQVSRFSVPPFTHTILS